MYKYLVLSALAIATPGFTCSPPPNQILKQNPELEVLLTMLQPSVDPKQPSVGNLYRKLMKHDGDTIKSIVYRTDQREPFYTITVLRKSGKKECSIEAKPVYIAPAEVGMCPKLKGLELSELVDMNDELCQ